MLTDIQLGTKPNTQTHDAIYSLFAIIQYSKYTLENPTYVAFGDYSTAYLWERIRPVSYRSIFMLR